MRSFIHSWFGRCLVVAREDTLHVKAREIDLQSFTPFATGHFGISES